ncbi:DUF4905 domain-containing protein [uncultured Mucilaginibacter sp.]|uniref:DUF4905 domain-containing protein n=1 Tax=uncultured Mucilaginibacter sp. TaxID=797541 RepID=UPI0025F93C8C|nr:DUF4905 domain-containing protein [uncultured Mucilaginibacter sp.]
MSTFKLLVAEHFAGEVWRMEVDYVTHTLLAEIRNIEDRAVSFASIDLKNGKTNFKNYTVDEKWLTGIETAYNGVLLLHFYENTASPAHKGLTAIEAATGKLLWYNFNLTFDHLSSNGPIVFDSRFQPATYSLLNIDNGVALRKFNSNDDLVVDNQIIVPQTIPMPANLPKLPSESNHNNVHYLEYNNWIIVSLHSLWAGQLKQSLYLVKDGVLIFEDILNTNIQKLQPEAFVLYRNQLIYLKDKVEIKVLNLS